MSGVELRCKTEAPTEPGWYYGRPWIEHPKQRPFPVLVRYYRGDAHYDPGLYANVPGLMRFELRHFDWFGPVAEVRESDANNSTHI